MKNFKKVLALVLVMATLFSLVTVAGARSLDYKQSDEYKYLRDDAVEEYEQKYYEDEKDVDYVEAVRILTYVGILNGYEEAGVRNFHPKNEIDRDEMAKMIAVLSNAGYDVEKLYASACKFADVTADHWAASYVAYCAETGIVAGRNATTFDPDASVTGLETAKMLLVVLGFDAQKQGYVGSSWDVNVLRDAKIMGLLEGFDKDWNIESAIKRDEAAHMMLNALKAPCVVGFLSDNVVTMTNALVSRLSLIYPATGTLASTVPGITGAITIGSYATLKDALDSDRWALYGNVIISDDILSEVLFDLYCEIGLDCFGRPVNEWRSYKGGKTNASTKPTNIVGTYRLTPDISTYDTDEVEFASDTFRLIDTTYDVILHIDGDRKTTVSNMNQAIDRIDFGKGVLVEVYELEERNEVYVAVINTYVGRIDQLNASKGTFSIEGLNPATFNTLTNKWFDNDYGFTSQDVKDDTVFLYWICKDGLHNIEVIEPEVMTVKRADVDGNGICTFTVDGKVYEYNYHAFDYLGNKATDPFALNAAFINGTNQQDTYDVYFDQYGYVIYHEYNDTAKVDVVVIDGDSWINEHLSHTADGRKYDECTCDFVYFEDNTEPQTVDVTAEFNDLYVEAAKQIDSNRGADPDVDILGQVKFVDEDTVLLSAATHAAYPGKGTSTFDIIVKKNNVHVEDPSNMLGTEKNLLNKDTQIIVRVPDYTTDKDDSFIYRYYDGIDEIDVSYKAIDFQGILDNELLDPDDRFEDTGRYYAYIYIDAEYSCEENLAFILKPAGASYDKLADGRMMGGEKFEAIVNGEEAIVVYNHGSGVESLLMLTGSGTIPYFPKAFISDLVLIGYTLDGELPVWADVGPAAPTTSSPKPDFLIKGGVLSWNKNNGTPVEWDGVLMDDDAKIWVAKLDKRGDWIAELLTQDEFNDYREEYGWNQLSGYAWYIDAEDETGRKDGLYDYLLITVADTEDVDFYY